MDCPEDCPHPTHHTKNNHGVYLIIILFGAIALIGMMVANG